MNETHNPAVKIATEIMESIAPGLRSSKPWKVESGGDVHDKASGTNISAAVRRLDRSDRGRQALKSLRKWIDTYYIGLDYGNQDAVHALIIAASNSPRTTLDAIDDALGGNDE